MKDNPQVSVVINNYNYGRFLQEAIDSALNQTYPHTEAIVVDDGSTDNSREIIASYGDKIIPVLKENGGQASAFNAGFAASKGDVICFLDSDDVFVPEKIAEIVAAFCDRTELGWCFHSLKWVEADGKTSIQKDLPESSPGEYDLRDHIKKGNLKDKLPSLPSTSGLCFKRSLLQQILPMPEAKTISLNDAYLDYTSIAMSKGMILDRELALYRIHGANAYTTSKAKQKLVQAKILIVTGYWVRVKYPSLSKFTNKLVAGGMGLFWRRGGIEPEYGEFVQKYLALLAPLEKLEINARAIYYCLTL
ncbi:glycosyltransferase family 2 protein [Argonema antarcticum]|uniref:glycosyltransferase family 2 protein n=1 Tax=Argonema antarcticum TaxID=2942763 RepID=UPI002013A3D0|nr:glycosyltransferase [Argonema antarcticum]MCL1472415.1 glycosyltransferase [Argonema antarcticum A004/B2]